MPSYGRVSAADPHVSVVGFPLRPLILFFFFLFSVVSVVKSTSALRGAHIPIKLSAPGTRALETAHAWSGKIQKRWVGMRTRFI